MSFDDWERLLSDSGRKTIDLAVEVVLRKPELVPVVVRLSLENKAQLSMRAARVVSLLAEQEPQLLTPAIPRFFERLPDLTVDGARREILRALVSLSEYFTDESQYTRLLDFALAAALNPAEKVAVRYHALRYIDMMYRRFPELKQELLAMTEILSSEEHSSSIKKHVAELAQKLKSDGTGY
ncbi:MAG: hypothetical protein Kow00127_02470 [Bacteroidales bacterium]